MEIYSSEKFIAKAIENNSSIAYCSQILSDSEMALPSDNYDKLKAGLNAAASIKDEDLYFHKSILVSTVWNKNDDVFTPLQVWAARHTPEDKPNNLEHDDSIIVGHMTSNVAIDENGAVIPDNIDVKDLPSKFHILTSEVIYKVFQNQDCQERANKLISQIEAGEKFVSMECRFDDFDYALQYEDGTIKFIERDNDTAFLTKYLRAYGGSGKYSDLKVGRVIKSLCFSGKGYVDKPANPDSVIFTHTNINHILPASYTPKKEFLSNSGVSFNSSENISLNSIIVEESLMSDNALEKRNEELQQTVTSLQAKIDELNEKLVKSDISKYESEISDLKAKLKCQDEELQTAKSELENVAGQLKKSEDTCKKLAQEKVGLESTLQEVEAAKIRASRISSLVDGGVDKQVATEKVDIFKNLTDEQFDAIAKEIVKANSLTTTACEVEETVDVIEKDEAEEVANAADLDNVEVPKDPNLSIVAEQDDSTLRKEILALASEFSSKKESK